VCVRRVLFKCRRKTRPGLMITRFLEIKKTPSDTFYIDGFVRVASACPYKTRSLNNCHGRSYVYIQVADRVRVASMTDAMNDHTDTVRRVAIPSAFSNVFRSIPVLGPGSSVRRVPIIVCSYDVRLKKIKPSPVKR